MARSGIVALGWLTLYLSILLLPIAIFMAVESPPSRGLGIELGVAFGFALLMIIVLQFLLSGRIGGVGAPFGIDVIVHFHRHAGILVLLFLVAHPLLLIVVDPEYLKFFDPRVNVLRAVFLSLAIVAMALLVVLSVWRTAFGLNYEWWRITHAALAAVVVCIGLAHAWQVGHYVQGIGKRGLLVGIGCAALSLLAYMRLIRPWQMRKRPFRVVDVRDEYGESSTIVLEPVGHRGMTFRSGQYAWLTLGKTPFTLQQNPFSFSSSDEAAPQRVEFTAKALGDFTRHLGEVEIGTTAYLEGAYGEFVLPADAPGAVFIMGGIGITPAISILRSARDKNDARSFLLIYGNTNRQEAVFQGELERLQQELDLRVVHVLAEPEPGWTGESGYIDEELLKRHLGHRERKFPIFVCGPEPMMDMVEKALLNLDVPLQHTRAERFNIV